MNLKECARLDGTALAAAFSDDQVAAREVADLARKGLDKVDATLNRRVRDIANRQACAADGHFTGVAFLNKDLVTPAAGIP
ncbi:MAG: hypothetical protein AAF367_05645 [Pseudomonadota bacterium]